MALSKIGLLGGSFDPVHLAHTALARAALHELSLDEVQLIPASQPWQRETLAATPLQRLAMLKIAVRDEPKLRINTIEIDRGGPTYTIDTLRQLPNGPEYVWILGADQLANFCTWHHWRDIAALVRLGVARRPGADAAAPAQLQVLLDQLKRPLLQLPFPAMDVSATAIRERLARGDSVQGLLHPEVAQYIDFHKLYRPNA
ncbi:MAG TPA: nicotinate (nicotinamide) nucleotide adenylyltransferase [Pusillimonas sp.]|uniref:nicotinate (nicotinamide) nucleotide adenylyltransferase n=1 Tax=Pusillimonas sp. TaxID=3040095 RepID=UPI002C040165|nr:nicotinate (nicotinamide) nucleotide adenylyltransferase [Pusillimonas sp.]HUH86716.1 nicotinate (nicotinamide) nucleotide adenylyltransferase [Pusillimonas sp.]